MWPPLYLKLYGAPLDAVTVVHPLPLEAVGRTLSLTVSVLPSVFMASRVRDVRLHRLRQVGDQRVALDGHAGRLGVVDDHAVVGVGFRRVVLVLDHDARGGVAVDRE